MTIALFPRRAHAMGRFTRLSSTLRETVGARWAAPEAPPAITTGRWATLPGEYAGPRARPLERALPAITAPGWTESVACAGHGPLVLHLAGTWAGSVVFEGSADGQAWFRLPLASLDGGPDASEASQPGLWRTLPDQPVAFIRLRVTRLTSGALLAAVAATPALHHAAERSRDAA